MLKKLLLYSQGTDWLSI